MKRLRESSALTGGVKTGRALLISAGTGSSGMYTEAVLRRDGATAFPQGTKMYLNHLGESEYWERSGSRDIRDLVGVTTEAATWDVTQNGLVAGFEILPHMTDLVESLWEHVGLSIEASGVVDDSGEVTELRPDPLNAVALVPVAGRGGKVTDLFESFTRREGDHGSIVSDDYVPGEEDGMKPEEIAQAVTEALAPTLTAIQEALRPTEPEATETETVDVAAIAEAIAVADLPKSARTRVYEAVKAGTEVGAAITAESEYIKELRANLAESATGHVQTADSGNFDATIKGW